MLNRRKGVTLLEMVAAIIIMGILAAVLYPTIGAQLRGARSGALASQLDAVREAIGAYQDNVGQYPRQLTQLVVSPTTGAVDLCGVPLTAAERNRWRGPYLTNSITGDLPVADYVINDTILRVPPTTSGGQVGILQLRAQQVDSAAAADLDMQFDGAINYGSGTILWTPTVPPVGTLTFQVNIRGC